MVLLKFRYLNMQMGGGKEESNQSSLYKVVTPLTFLFSLCATLPVEMIETLLKEINV